MTAKNTGPKLAPALKFKIKRVRAAKNYEVVDLRASASADNAGWMTKLLRNDEFQMVPAANLHAMFARFTPKHFTAGEVVIQQGNPAEYFYVITDGRCRASRRLSNSKRSITLAELNVGDTFGEEALITGSKRQSTVTMLTAGTVMKLSKDDFKELLSDPIITFINNDEADKIISAGGLWLDVGTSRLENLSRGTNVAHIPMQILRHKCGSLNKQQHHVVCCNDITHSCAAAHVLRQDGFLVSVLSA
ncbi:MAG: cyclic nucleotide-binding domain-containing protein [Gammaproteobacteria bacterium]